MPLPSSSPINPKPLKGKRIIVTAYDLEQSEHRGIAVYSKALIRSLKEEGAEVWLLTEFSASMRSSGLRKLPSRTKAVIQSSRVLDQLAHGKRITVNPWLNKTRIGSKIISFSQRLEDILEIIRRPRNYKKQKVREIRLDVLFDNPYLRNDRLSYLQNVTGLLCAKKVFFTSQLAATLAKQTPVSIDLEGFDALLTTCPLNIKPLNVPVFVQTVHDLIPIEYVQHGENELIFGHRLQACLPARKLYVSKATEAKFHQHIESGLKKKPNTSKLIEKTIIQPPSLIFPDWLTEDQANVCDLAPVSFYFRPNEKKSLNPFGYFLFNSSVESRKNILFLVKAYAQSNLGNQGVRLCITGKLKKDSYSKAVREVIKHEPGILLTGYIDESTKLDLYLNALALLSPSLVEGFGIPSLDAACLGMQAIVSDCASHREIRAIDDFREYLLLVSTLETREWAIAMQSIAKVPILFNKEYFRKRQQRISRYKEKCNSLENAFRSDLAELLIT